MKFFELAKVDFLSYFSPVFRMRRVSYGNSTHLNMSVIVGVDNKAIIKVALDRQDKDYFACDAGKFLKYFD